MIAYRIAGVTINSSFPLPELAPAERDGQHGDTAWVIRIGVIDTRGAASIENTEESEKSGEEADWPAIKRCAGWYHLRFSDVATFAVNLTSRHIICQAGNDTDDGMLRHLLLDHVLPRSFAMGGSLVLHASAVATPHGVVAFSGPSGSGKSTMAAGFLSDGYPIVADDFLVLQDDSDCVRPVPSYPGLRLWPDTASAIASVGREAIAYAQASTKLRVSTPDVRTKGGPDVLAAVVALAAIPFPRSSFHIDRLRGHQAMMTLFGQAFRLDPYGPDGPEREFDRFGRLVRQTTVLSLEFEHDYGALPAVREAILDTLHMLPLSIK